MYNAYPKIFVMKLPFKIYTTIVTNTIELLVKKRYDIPKNKYQNQSIIQSRINKKKTRQNKEMYK